MSEHIVQATSADTIRIVLPGGAAVQIPARYIVAVDAVLRHCAIHCEALSCEPVEDDETGAGWQADLDFCLTGEVYDTPWAAIAALADELEE